MILVDIYDMASWWTLVIALQVVVISTYFFYTKSRSKGSYNPHSKGSPVEWSPLPLIEHEVVVEEPPLMGKIDENCLNVGATSFLCLDKNETIMESSIKTLNKYGVGSCGPRGFYGTIDVHLELEERLAKFLEVEETCVYSYGFSTIASAIPAYAKKGDIIFADEKVWFAIQKGFDASRSTIRYFRHNDTAHLEELLSAAAKKKELSPKRRAFLVVEAIYINTGEMCPLKKVVALARQYKLRIILDESLTIGVLGKHGRGLTEHLDIPRDEIDLIVGSLEHSFATIGGFCAGSHFIVEHQRLSGLDLIVGPLEHSFATIGGFCAGSHFIVEHQRLSGLGYCFSASLPPMLTTAALGALDAVEGHPGLLWQLEEVSVKVHTALKALKNYRIGGDPVSPVKHIYINREDLTDRLKHSYLRNIANYSLEKGIAFAVAAYLRDAEVNCPEPSIRFASSVKLSDENIAKICELLDEAYEKVGPKPDLQAV